jgi:hypothetical protein
MSEIKKLTIDRSEWGSGFLHLGMKGGPATFCALGHLARACGVPENEMDLVSELGDMPQHSWTKLPERVRPRSMPGVGEDEPVTSEAPLAIAITSTNDNKDCEWPTSMVEASLRRLFETGLGIDLEFTGDSKEWTPGYGISEEPDSGHD